MAVEKVIGKTPPQAFFFRIFVFIFIICIGIVCIEESGEYMKIMYALVIIIVIVSIVSTLLVSGKGDENYSGSAKRNTTNLTLIYVVIIFFALIALGVYISFFA